MKTAKPTRILLVDDHPMFLHLIADYLRLNGADEVTVVGVAHDGEEALYLAKKLRPKIVLLDLIMPGPSGFDTIPRLRALVPKVHIIILTARDLPAYRQATLDAGADDFVTKTNMFTELMPTIRRARDKTLKRKVKP